MSDNVIASLSLPIKTSQMSAKIRLHFSLYYWQNSQAGIQKFTKERTERFGSYIGLSNGVKNILRASVWKH